MCPHSAITTELITLLSIVVSTPEKYFDIYIAYLVILPLFAIKAHFRISLFLAD